MAGATSTPITTCSGKESVDMDSSTEQITSAGLMAMFGKMPVTSKEHKKLSTKGSSNEFKEMSTEVSSSYCSMIAFKHIVEIKTKNVKKLMGRKLTNESSNVLMSQIGLAGLVLISADISNDSFFLAITK